MFSSLLLCAGESCGDTLVLFCSDQSVSVGDWFMPIEGCVGGSVSFLCVCGHGVVWRVFWGLLSHCMAKPHHHNLEISTNDEEFWT